MTLKLIRSQRHSKSELLHIKTCKISWFRFAAKFRMHPYGGFPINIRANNIKTNLVSNNITSRERPKSAPYLRLKNSRRTSKCQSIGELGTLLRKNNKSSQKTKN